MKYISISFLDMLTPFAMDFKVDKLKRGRNTTKWASVMLEWPMKMLMPHS